ncbi:histidine kinase [Ornithinibacillus salinisoli]|uniref:Histidine kinase n=1 Tax=Ornithinibacillus salinisoli TaxID=1848459 RepID=A0ABW4VYM4_9BACI
MKVSKLNFILYVIVALLVLVPIFIMLVSDVTFSESLRDTVVGSALALIIVGKVLTIIEKKKEKKRIAGDIGIVIGIFIVLLFRILS